MMANVYDQKGKKLKQTRLPSEIFDVKVNADLLHQVVVSQTANRRQNIAHAKDRSEVRGGGKKPWQQKKTGRARHGSIRSPIWRGGGVTFGPTNTRNYKKIIPKKMRRKALLMALSAKAKGDFLVVLDALKLESHKTKGAAALLGKLPFQEKSKEKSSLVVIPGIDKNALLAFNNLPRISVMQAKDLNALDLLSCQYLIMPQECIKVIKETFVK